LFAAGLLLESVRKLQRVDPGFREDHLVLLSVRADKYRGPAALRVHTELRTRLAALPGVERVASFQDIPLGGANITTQYFSINDVGPGFFETLGIPLVAGRALTAQDTVRDRPVVVISESVARELFGDRSPLGARLDVFGANSEVVGVVKDARYRSLRLPPDPMVYRMSLGSDSYAIRTRGDPASLIASVRRAVRAVARDVPISSLEISETDATLVRERIVSVLCGWFGAFALVLAGIGLYGRLSYAVSERKGEIGVRMALGARQTQVVWAVLRDAIVLTLIGVAVGLPLAVWSTRLVQRLLFSVRGTAVEGWSAMVVVAVVTLVAGYVPARRAAAVDPVIALRAR
jgi:predicted permease